MTSEELFTKLDKIVDAQAVLIEELDGTQYIEVLELLDRQNSELIDLIMRLGLEERKQ